MPRSIIYSEKYGTSGISSIYVRNSKGSSSLIELSDGLESPPRTNIFSRAADLFTEVFLPQGFPVSVRDDYISYQIWDTVQAFCSTISGILTTHAVMKSVGVGDATATALSATITWVLKDGIGMIGRIIFAWWKGHALDTDAKKWRLFADIVNDAAMFLELLLLPMFPQHPTQVLCLTTSMKGIVGVAGGASRAAITQHHAIRGNNGDVSAKDGSQETCVNLMASTVGMALLTYTEDATSVWLLFSVVTLLHLVANYKAVRSLALVTFNSERLCLYLHKYLTTENSFSPRQVNQWESVFVGFSYGAKDLCGFHVKLGCSVKHLVQSGVMTSEELLVVSNMFRHRLYLLLPHRRTRTVYVLFASGATTLDVLQAYFHSVLVALTIALVDNVPIKIDREISKSKILTSVEAGLKKLNTSKFAGFPIEAVSVTNDIVDREFKKFHQGILSGGWSTDSHSLLVEEWRGSWHDSGSAEPTKDK
ncbi:RUS family member 1-like [Macrosteles quadrilineatus]|uniref:RUS family member 1-like n=1 Tax=Macrosteles quadrilineatus TaxID=74068 RepID=UPI0023E10A41|nr:RUS family member 1-like [Macrosteles quadrilineatus]